LDARLVRDIIIWKPPTPLPGRSRVRSPMVSLEFFSDIILKGGGCVGLTTLPPSCADCLEIWEP